MAWKEALKKGHEITLCSVSRNGTPHAIVVISDGFVDGKLLLSACQMYTTIQNIKRIEDVCVITKLKKEYFRIKGKARIYASGKYFNLATKRNEGPPVQYAIVITIYEVFDLDKVKKIF
jgi:hypothetical protein